MVRRRSVGSVAGFVLALASCDRAASRRGREVEATPTTAVFATTVASPSVLPTAEYAGPALSVEPPPRPRVRRVGSYAGFGATNVAFPDADVEQAPRIVEEDGGTLDLARSRDGRTLWTRRYWDDGTTDVNRFELQWDGEEKLVLQFVDGVTEPWQGSYDPMAHAGRRVLRMSDGTRREQILDAWPVDVARARAFSLVTHQWLPLVPATDRTPRTPERLQWMAFVAACPEVDGPCVLHGAPRDVCRRYFATLAPEDAAVWIAPKGCPD